MEWEGERDDTQLMFGIVMTSSSNPCCVSGRWSSTVDRNWETVRVAYLWFVSIVSFVHKIFVQGKEVGR